MVFALNSAELRARSNHSRRMGLAPDHAEVTGPPDEHEPARDWKKFFLVLGLGALSWVATYVGMLELIEANMGELPITHRIIVGFSVAMLMTMIIWLLDQIFSPIGSAQRLIYVAGYIFLSAISVGFGFGFYWKVLESRAESTRSAESAISGVQSSLNAASARLEQLNATLTQLAAISREKAILEREKGTSCPNSRPGDGPRRRMRDEDAARFAFAAEFVSGRVETIKTDLRSLDADFNKVSGGAASTFDPKTGTRNEFLKAINRKLDMTVANFNALRSDPQLKEVRTSLAERAAKTTFGNPKKGGFVCPDPQLAQALRGAVRAMTELPVLDKPEIAAVEGSEATIEAFRRLAASMHGLLTLKPPPSAEEIRRLQKKALQSLDREQATKFDAKSGGLTSRDYVPLAIAIFVDLCLLLVSLARPTNRLHGLVPKMRSAERGPVIEILSRFNEIHRDQEIRENFELFRHVVFDVHGIYYVAVPLDAPQHLPAQEREDLRTEAQLLANLFTSFEKDRIFTRTWTPFTSTIKQKLSRQGSKFAGSDAFRVYRFRDGAWSEIILGAVMGAARRAEANALLQRLEETPTLRDDFQKREPVFEQPTHTVSRTSSSARSDSARRPRRTPTQSIFEQDIDGPTRPTNEKSADAKRTADRARQTSPMDPKFVAQFGVHARHAHDELTRPKNEKPVEAVNTAANSNTRPRDADKKAAADQNSSTNAIFTPPPAQTATEIAKVDPTPHVDVILQREKATVSMPLEKTNAETVIAHISEALQNHSSATSPDSTTDMEPNDFFDFAVEPEEDSQIEYPATDADDDLESDPETADAIAIADRLRPKLIRERS